MLKYRGLATEKNRIRNLSTRWLSLFKSVLVTVYVLICSALSYTFMFDSGSLEWSGIAMAITYGWIFYLLIRITVKVHHVEFDDEFLYVLRKNQDLIIPLENIESVEIATIGGVYKVNLYHADQVGKEFYFKQSLWYPLNYKRCDALVNVLRRNIESAKRKKPVLATNTMLHS